MSIWTLATIFLCVGAIHIVGIPVGGVLAVKFGRWYSKQTGSPTDEEWEGFLLLLGAIASWFTIFFIGCALALVLLGRASNMSRELAKKIP